MASSVWTISSAFGNIVFLPFLLHFEGVEKKVWNGHSDIAGPALILRTMYMYSCNVSLDKLCDL